MFSNDDVQDIYFIHSLDVIKEKNNGNLRWYDDTKSDSQS